MAKHLVSWDDVMRQSKQVFSQFGESKWIPFAKDNCKLPRKNANELNNVGLGKFKLLVAMGESTEEQIEVIKKYRDKIEITVCDKGFKPLLEHGIKADYVMLCDCNIPFEYLDGAINETVGVKLLATPYANLDWTTKWKGDKYFFINRDALGTEKLFLDIMGKDERTIPAGSNVSNAMLIFWTGCDEVTNVNFGAYEQYLLVGYDYSWRPEGKYYAFLDPKPKRYYMNHRTLMDFNSDICFTSENLLFSVKWLYTYITAFQLPIVNCSGRGMLDIPYKMDLEKTLANINNKKEIVENVQKKFEFLKHAHYTYKESKNLFEESRRQLFCQSASV